MPVNVTDVIYTLWEALLNSDCVAVWSGGETALVSCRRRMETFRENPPLAIFDPLEYLDEYFSLESALADVDLQGHITEIIINAGGTVLRTPP